MLDAPSWTDDRVALAKELYRDGYSAAKIAAQIGGVTRNAVVGKAHRDHWSRGPTSPKRATRCTVPALAHEPKRVAKPPVVTARQKINVHHQVDEVVHVVPPTPTADLDIPIMQQCSVLQLDETKCRWPIGEPGTPDFFFCGSAPLEGTPYCRHHAARAYQGPGASQRLSDAERMRRLHARRRAATANVVRGAP